MTETEQVRERYERRKATGVANRYDPLAPSNYLTQQEKDRAIIRWIQMVGLAPVREKRLLEIGCGSGSNLLTFLQLGFLPEHLVGNELLPDRAAGARHRLPAAVRILEGDASELALEDGSFDIVFQSTVFTSLLDDAFQQKLADKMWALTRTGGGILWYDFRVNNPGNPDVRGVPLRRVRALFPAGTLQSWSVTLAPPISRRVTRLHPTLYSVFNTLPFLRTHLLCWIRKL